MKTKRLVFLLAVVAAAYFVGVQRGRVEALNVPELSPFEKFINLFK